MDTYTYNFLVTYGFLGIVFSIGIAWTYWSQYKHRKHHPHHHS